MAPIEMKKIEMKKIDLQLIAEFMAGNIEGFAIFLEEKKEIAGTEADLIVDEFMEMVDGTDEESGASNG